MSGGPTRRFEEWIGSAIFFSGWIKQLGGGSSGGGGESFWGIRDWE